MRISILLRLEMKRRCIAAFSNKCKLLRSPLIRLAVRSTPCPQFGIVVFEQINCSNTRCLIEPAPALFCHWQGRYSGSRLGEGFYRYALCKKLGCSCQLPHSTTPDSYIQLCPRGTLTADQRRACAARPRGKNEKLPGGSLLLTRPLKFFPATGAGRQCRLPVLSA